MTNLSEKEANVAVIGFVPSIIVVVVSRITLVGSELVGWAGNDEGESGEGGGVWEGIVAIAEAGAGPVVS